jgi:hypothetical protein
MAIAECAISLSKKEYLYGLLEEYDRHAIFLEVICWAHKIPLTQ